MHQLSMELQTTTCYTCVICIFVLFNVYVLHHVTAGRGAACTLYYG